MHPSLSAVVILTAIIILHLSSASDWNYADQGPDVWSDQYPLCAGREQSPINIRTPCTIYQPFSSFTFSSAYTQSQRFKLLNNGHTIVATYSGTTKSSPFKLTGGNLDGTYELTNFHLHWGENYKSGSEHRVNGKKYSGEIHFVHTDPSTGKIAVLGMLIESISSTNTKYEKRDKDDQASRSVEWKRYLSVIKNLQQANDAVEVDLNLSWLESHNLKNFWRYQGSLTTPPCTEGITWTVFSTTISVNDDEFQVLRHDILIKDFRDPQPVNGRQVLQSFKSNDQMSKKECFTCLIE